MNFDFNRLLEVTVTLIIVYYVATHGKEISSVISAASSSYVSGVKALQGR